jgi:transglutaminase-like putative cysteine protease
VKLTFKRLADGGIVTVLVGLALAPMIPVFGLPGILIPGLGGLLLGASVAALCAWRRLQPLLTMAVMAAGYLLFGPAIALPEMASQRVLPSLEAEQWLLTGLTGVWRRLLTVELPVGGGGGFGLAPFLLAYIGTTVGASLAIRLPYRSAALGALAPIGVTVVAVIMGARESVAAVVLGLAVGLGGAVWAAWRSKTLQLRRAVAVTVTLAIAAAAGLGGGLVSAERDRLVVRELLEPPFDPRDYPSPLASYRRYIKNDLKSKVLLRAADLPSGGVVKLAVMDYFDGLVWNVAGGGAGQASGNFGRMPLRQAAEESATILLEDYDTDLPWLYSVGSPTAVTFFGDRAPSLREALRVNAVTGSLVLPPTRPESVTYSVETAWGTYRPPLDAIAAAAAGSTIQPVSVRVQAADMTAANVTREATTAGAKALALEQFLQNGYYSDGQEGQAEGANRVEALAGHGADRINSLLNSEIMVGNAEQYASAMAVMAQSLGLPARVVMGYAPSYGEQAATDSTKQGPQGDGTAAGTHTFTGADMTAWVEIELATLGWVPFFPTPNRQDSPEEAEQQQDPQPEPQIVQPPPPEAKPSEPPDEEMAPVPVSSAKPIALPTEPFQFSTALVATLSAVGLLLVLAGAMALVLLLKSRRRNRRQLRGPPSSRIVAGWEEILDQLHDMRFEPLDGSASAMTRTEVASQGPPVVRAALGRLATQSDAAAFGSLAIGERHAVEYWNGVAAASQMLRGQLGWWARLRSGLSWSSLRYRRRQRRR